MAAPTKLLIALTTGGNPVITIPIPASLQSLDSGQQASTQTGYAAADQLVRNIFKAGCFYDGISTWYPTSVIQSVTSE